MSQPSHPPVPNTGSSTPTIERPTSWAWWADPHRIKTEDRRTILVGGATDENGADVAAVVVVTDVHSVDVLLAPDQADRLARMWADARAVPHETPVDTWIGKSPVRGVWHPAPGIAEEVHLYVGFQKTTVGPVAAELDLISQARFLPVHMIQTQADEFAEALNNVREALRADVNVAGVRRAGWVWQVEPAQVDVGSATVLVGIAKNEDQEWSPLVVVVSEYWTCALPLDVYDAKTIADELDACQGALRGIAERETARIISEAGQ